MADAGCFDPATQEGLDPWSTAFSEFKSGNFAMMAKGAWNFASCSEVENQDEIIEDL